MRDKYGNNDSLSDITTSDEDAYQGRVVETYYRIVNDVMKRYDHFGEHVFIPQAGRMQP